MAGQRNTFRLGRTLSVDPRTKGIAYAYFEDGQLRDCRVKEIRSHTVPTRVKRVMHPYLVFLLDYYAPHAVVVPDARAIGTRARSSASHRVLDSLRREARSRGIKVHVVSNLDIKEWLRTPTGEEPKNRRHVNREVLRRYPELVSVLPVPRSRAWDTDRYFHPLFHAVAMYIAFERKPSLNEIRDSAKR